MKKAEHKEMTPERAQELVEISSDRPISDALDAMEIVRIFANNGEVYVPQDPKQFMNFARMIGAIWYGGAMTVLEAQYGLRK